CADFAARFFSPLPLAGAGLLLGLLVVAALALAWKREALGRPLMVAAAMVFVGPAAAAFIAIAASLLRPGDFWRAYPLVAYLALYSVLMLIMGALLARFENVGRERLRAASWLLVLLLGAALSLALPGATIFFLI